MRVHEHVTKFQLGCTSFMPPIGANMGLLLPQSLYDLEIRNHVVTKLVPMNNMIHYGQNMKRFTEIMDM